MTYRLKKRILGRIAGLSVMMGGGGLVKLQPDSQLVFPYLLILTFCVCVCMCVLFGEGVRMENLNSDFHA